MSRDLHQLAVVATRGTSRMELPAPSGALKEALSSVPGDTPEALLLGRAALLGLHARAGAPLVPAAAPPPTLLAAAARPIPAPLAALLPALHRTDPELAAQALGTVMARGWTLNAAQVLRLHHLAPDLTRLLWTLADVRARATLDAHPLHRQAQKAEADAAWTATLEGLAEARRTDPERAAQHLQALWVSQPAEQRRALLALVRRDLRPEDRPVLDTATQDRSHDLQKQARQLLGHLRGPLQDELLTALTQAVKVSGQANKKITFGAFDLPPALGRPRAGHADDSDLHRLLGALPTPLILETLQVSWQALLKAARAHHWSLPNELQEPPASAPDALAVPPTVAHGRLRELIKQPTVSARTLWAAVCPLQDLGDLMAQPGDVQTALLGRTLDLFQREGTTWETTQLRDVLGRGLCPDLTVPMPAPRPFELPPRPTKLPSWQTPASWEDSQRHEHARREEAAFEAWRALTHSFQVRRQWRDTLAAHA
ncbi:DUF5691 domain-containing protein (plasmid) [Deinococcus taeanensis]|uniref:DUF5691 domain-containing protein n=1 Tax=Deinococcus taeanensis TaxID=2737050 RepID=UPI001CDD639F|nr:DUF5691 domain-containing protein [Deinococcus taeanensis]UBV44661.1 DUF5691 domain-containing protein [Deinococcus taeanensis]